MGKLAGFVGGFLAIVLLLVVVLIAGIDADQQPPLGAGCGATNPPAAAGAPGGDKLAPPGTFVKPVDAGTPISSPYGPRAGGFHKGLDLAGPLGAPIYAAADGVVAAAGPATGFGNWIVIDHNIASLGGKVSTVYGHMYDGHLYVKTGDTVRAGQHIADIGANGEASGPHLHFEMWIGGRIPDGSGNAVDPQPQYDAAPAPGATGPVPSAPTTTPGGAASLAADQQGTSTSPTAAAAAAATGPCGSGAPGVGGSVKAGTVPPEYLPWLQKAGQMCPQITASLLAAQINQESGFNAQAVSPSGAQGPAQFMPATWPNYGKDDDGNGTAAPFDIGDAVMAQGRYMCAIAATIDKAITDGKVKDPSGPAELYLAGYNAGEGAVLASGGFPTGSPDYETQTRPYAEKILASEPSYRDAVASPAPTNSTTPTTASGPSVLAQAPN